MHVLFVFVSRHGGHSRGECKVLGDSSWALRWKPTGRWRHAKPGWSCFCFHSGLGCNSCATSFISFCVVSYFCRHFLMKFTLAPDHQTLASLLKNQQIKCRWQLPNVSTQVFLFCFGADIKIEQEVDNLSCSGLLLLKLFPLIYIYIWNVNQRCRTNAVLWPTQTFDFLL